MSSLGHVTSGKMQLVGEGSGEARRKMRGPEKTGSEGWGGQRGELKTEGDMRTVSKGVKGFFKKAGNNQDLWWHVRRPPQKSELQMMNFSCQKRQFRETLGNIS